jgi:uncharacterized coiled-coil protein SlyX
MNKRVIDVYIKKMSRFKKRLLRLSLLTLELKDDLLPEDEDCLNEFMDGMDQLTKELTDKFTELQLEIKHIEEHRELTPEEEEHYICQISEIAKETQTKIEKLEKVLSKLLDRLLDRVDKLLLQSINRGG